jgi:hypothetical protein
LVIEKILEKNTSAKFTPGLSQPKSSPLDPCRFQFTLSHRDSIKPNLFLEFIETNTEFHRDRCKKKVEAGILVFLASNKDLPRDITPWVKAR